MSMISAQCDKLRNAAKKLDSYDAGYGSIASMMRDAADTIWELRGSVYRERAEADRLREELEAVGIAAYSYGRGDLKAENAKLRGLVLDYARYRSGDCQHCGYAEQCKAQQTNCYKVSVNLHNRARELGVEVYK